MPNVGSGQFTGGRSGTPLPHFMQRSDRSGVLGAIKALWAYLADVLGATANVTSEEFTNVPASDDDGWKTSVASVASTTDYSGSAINGALAGTKLDPPRNVLITTAGATPADAPADATIYGEDINGVAMQETITVAQTATTSAGVKCFAKVTRITMPAADGTGATLKFGTGNILGLAKKIRSRAGAVSLIKEHAAGSVVTNGVVASAATSAPNGSYTPNSAPDGSRDYWIAYERDLS